MVRSLDLADGLQTRKERKAKIIVPVVFMEAFSEDENQMRHDRDVMTDSLGGEDL